MKGVVLKNIMNASDMPVIDMINLFLPAGE